jgi:hypothetical protein
MIHTAGHKLDFSKMPYNVADKIRHAAKYVVYNSLIDVLKRDDIFSSIQALIEAGIMKLPFSPMFMEFDITNSGRWFVLIEEDGKDEESKFICQTFFLHRATDICIYSSKDITIQTGHEGFLAYNCKKQEDGYAAICAASMALLFLNTRGIDKVYIEAPEKLNKQRVNKGREAIPSVTVLRIGTVYDSSGKASLPTNVKRVHLRCAHARRQHYGKNFSEVKWVYIPPVLVNFKPGMDENVIPKPKLVKL